MLPSLLMSTYSPGLSTNVTHHKTGQEVGEFTLKRRNLKRGRTSRKTSALKFGLTNLHFSVFKWLPVIVSKCNSKPAHPVVCRINQNNKKDRNLRSIVSFSYQDLINLLILLSNSLHLHLYSMC